jgi:hypothetical protein
LFLVASILLEWLMIMDGASTCFLFTSTNIKLKHFSIVLSVACAFDHTKCSLCLWAHIGAQSYKLYIFLTIYSNFLKKNLIINFYWSYNETNYSKFNNPCTMDVKIMKLNLGAHTQGPILIEGFRTVPGVKPSLPVSWNTYFWVN